MFTDPQCTTLAPVKDEFKLSYITKLNDSMQNDGCVSEGMQYAKAKCSHNLMIEYSLYATKSCSVTDMMGS